MNFRTEPVTEGRRNPALRAPDPDSIVGKLEYSWLFVVENVAVTAAQWLEVNLILAGMYNQGSLIVRDGDQTTIRSRKGDVLTRLTSNEEVASAWQLLARECERRPRFTKSCAIGISVDERSLEAEPSGYVVTGSGKDYEQEVFLAQTNGHFGNMLFSSAGIRYRV